MQNVGLFCMYFIGICTFFSKWRLRFSVTDALFIGEEGSISRWRTCKGLILLLGRAGLLFFVDGWVMIKSAGLDDDR